MSPTTPTQPGLTLSARFAAIAALYPDNVAITSAHTRVTYRELDLRARRIAAVLRTHNARPDALVAVCMERGPDMIAAMLGIVYAGAAYLPLDPNYPDQRLYDTLDDAAPIAILTDPHSHARLRLSGLPVLDTATLLADDTITPAAPSTATTPESLAYVIYTSGSTGRPKGVMVTQHNVLRLFDATNHWFHFTPRDVWTMFHSFAFDFSVWEIWGALLFGGRLVIVPFTVSRSPEEFHALLAQERVTVLNQTPTAFSMLIQAEQRLGAAARPLSLRTVVFGGEALNLRALAPWFAMHSDEHPQLINMYGITETTVHVTFRRIYAEEAARENESLIGEPIPDLTLRLLDAELKPVAPGQVGEICVGGFGVARGYLNREDLTAQRFIADPFTPGGRLYRSGDLARQREDGELVYLGRADRQVKINGFRIELGEIEAALTEAPGVNAATVVVDTDSAGRQRLLAYVVPATVDLNAVRAHAETTLPKHMRPSHVLALAALPMNNNGKVDRDALPRPAQAAPATLTAATPEARIAAIWSDLLGTAVTDPTANFFDAGGTSLLLVELRHRLEAAFSMTVPMMWLFEQPTVRGLAAKLTPQTTAAPAVSDRAAKQREALARMKQVRSMKGAA